ncbi:MAG: ACP S-malonyltransferase [Acidimicrobiia bacterium]
MSYAVLFPGQGSQFVGMGADLFDAKPELLGADADAVLGFSLREMCLNGPEEVLTRTEHAQPALYATAYALWSELESRLSGGPAGAAGHSLGEYTALAAAGALDFFEGLVLVAERGRAMAAAADIEHSGMAALLGSDEESADTITAGRRAAGGRLWVANINAPGQIVVAGGAADIEWVVANAREFGVRRAIPLKVAGAFHSPYMESAAVELGQAVAEASFRSPSFPVWSNVAASPHTEEIGPALVAQLTAPVRFGESLQEMAAAGIGSFVHVGAGDVTAGLAKRSVEGTETVVVSSLEDVDEAVGILSTA